MFDPTPTNPMVIPPDPLAPPPTPAPAPPLPLDGETRRRLWFEVAVVLALAVIPDLYNAAYVFLTAPTPEPYGNDQSTFSLLRSLQVIMPLLYIAWRSGEGFAAFGMVKFRFWIDLGLGVLLFIVSFVVVGMARGLIGDVLGELWGTPPAGSEQVSRSASILLMIAGLTANSIAEELAIWGVLSTRLQRLRPGSPLVLLLPAAAFASYHIYHGGAAMLSIFVGGCLHGLAFRFTGRLWPLVIAHTLTNFALTLPYFA